MREITIQKQTRVLSDNKKTSSLASHPRKMVKRRIIEQAGKISAAGLALICLIGILLAPMAYAGTEMPVWLTVKQSMTDGSLTESSNGLYAASANTPADTSADDRVITYRLTSETGTPMPAGSTSEGYTFTLTGNDDSLIGPITFTEPGTYKYALHCVTGGGDGCIYDRREYTIDIYVLKDVASYITIIHKDDIKTSEIKFDHIYEIEPPPLPSDPLVMVDPPVVKTISPNILELNDSFFFQLKAENLSNPMPEGSEDGIKTIRISGSGRAEFGTWSYTREGTYFYTVSEINNKISGYTYDDTVYTITDSVKALDGQLTVTRVVTNGSDRQVESLPFINTYKSNGTPTAPETKPKTTPTPTPTPTLPLSPSTPNTSSPIENPDNPAGPISPADPSFPSHRQGDKIIPGKDATTYIEIDEFGTPVGEWHLVDGAWIFDEYVPMSEMPDETSGIASNSPKTGDESQILLNIIMFGIAAATSLGSIIYLITGKRRKDRE